MGIILFLLLLPEIANRSYLRGSWAGAQEDTIPPCLPSPIYLRSRRWYRKRGPFDRGTESCASSCSLENRGEEWGEPGQLLNVARLRITARFSCVGNPCAGLIRKPPEALVGMLRGLGHMAWKACWAGWGLQQLASNQPCQQNYFSRRRADRDLATSFTYAFHPKPAHVILYFTRDDLS